MKIIVGTPKSGSTFITRWIHNENPTYVYLKEHFQPLWYPKGDPNLITRMRLEQLTDNVVFKVHAGKETSELVWNYIYEKNVILIERKNKLAQFVSLGHSYLSGVWTVYNKFNNIKKGYYRKEWFDDLCYRLDDLESRKSRLNIEHTYFYEDIATMPNNGMLPIKQHTDTVDTLLNMFENKEEFLGWYYDRYRR